MLVGLSLHVAGWLLSLRLNEPTVAAWRAHRRSKMRSGAAPLEVGTGQAGGHAPQPGGGGGGGSGGGSFCAPGGRDAGSSFSRGRYLCGGGTAAATLQQQR